MTVEGVGFTLVLLVLVCGGFWLLFRGMLAMIDLLDRLCDWWERRHR